MSNDAFGTDSQADRVSLHVDYAFPTETFCCHLETVAGDCAEEAYGGLHPLQA